MARKTRRRRRFGSAGEDHRGRASGFRYGYRTWRRIFSQSMRRGDCEGALIALLASTEKRKGMAEHALAARTRADEGRVLARTAKGLGKLERSFLNRCVVR